MKPIYGLLLGVVFVSAAIPMTVGGLMWWVSSNEPLTPARSHHGPREDDAAVRTWYDTWRMLIEPRESGPIEQPAGTVLMTVRIAADDPVGRVVSPGYKVTVLAVSQSEKRHKEVVTPLMFGALVMEVDTSASEANELLLSVAVPVEQVDLLTYAMDGETTLRVQLPNCGGWSTHETDTTVFLAPAKSAEELLVFLSGE